MPKSRSRDGFTLLEVLAAVAVLGIWYIILATVGIQGLQAQGESHRRLEASFIADDVIAEIEAALSTGQAPEEGIEESERDDYKVRVEVASYDLDVPPLETDKSSLDGSSLAPQLVKVTNLLGGTGIGVSSPLRSIRVLVTWTEGHDEKSVTRDTYAFDLESVRSDLRELEQIIASAEEEAAESGEDGGRPTAAELEAMLPQ